MNDHLATLQMLGGRPTLRFERRLNHSPAKVWKAISDPAELSQWFPATVRTELRAGAPMRFSFDGDLDLGSPYAEGEILELDPPKVYAFRWADAAYRFELLPTDDGCRLVFTTTLSGRSTDGDLPSTARQAPGWDGCLDVLVARLDVTQAPEHGQDWFLHRAEAYVEEFGLGDGEVRPDSTDSVLRFERDLVPSVEQVWELLSEGAEHAAGSPPPLPATHGYVTAEAVTEVVAPRTLEYDWSYEGADAGRVRFALGDQDPIGCRLVLTVTVPAALVELRPLLLAAWHTWLEVFFAALQGDVRCPWPADRTEQLRKTYADRLT